MLSQGRFKKKDRALKEKEAAMRELRTQLDAASSTAGAGVVAAVDGEAARARRAGAEGDVSGACASAGSVYSVSPPERPVTDIDTSEGCRVDGKTALDVDVAGVGRLQAAGGVGVDVTSGALQGEGAMRMSPWMNLHDDTSDAMDSGHLNALLAAAPPRLDATHGTDSHGQGEWASNDAGALLGLFVVCESTLCLGKTRASRSGYADTGFATPPLPRSCGRGFAGGRSSER
jgi:hypothetical protein